jgi:hypothetical protein
VLYESLNSLKNKERALSYVNWEQVFLLTLLPLHYLRDDPSVELKEIIGTEILLIKLCLLIARKLVTREENISYVLAKRALESFKIETYNLSQITLAAI